VDAGVEASAQHRGRRRFERTRGQQHELHVTDEPANVDGFTDDPRQVEPFGKVAQPVTVTAGQPGSMSPGGSLLGDQCPRAPGRSVQQPGLVRERGHETMYAAAPRFGSRSGDHAGQPQWFASATYGRQGSLRKLGHAGSAVGTLTPGTTGNTRLDGIVGENWSETVAVAPAGCVCANDQMGCVPLGAAIVTRMRDPAR